MSAVLLASDVVTKQKNGTLRQSNEVASSSLSEKRCFDEANITEYGKQSIEILELLVMYIVMDSGPIDLVFVECLTLSRYFSNRHADLQESFSAEIGMLFPASVCIEQHTNNNQKLKEIITFGRDDDKSFEF